MKVTANGTTTSPVKRGVWVAERLLGTPIPPPPPNIEPVDPDTRGAKTLREQLALAQQQGLLQRLPREVRSLRLCVESFDVTGAFRTKYREANPDFPSIAAALRPTASLSKACRSCAASWPNRRSGWHSASLAICSPMPPARPRPLSTGKRSNRLSHRPNRTTTA